MKKLFVFSMLLSLSLAVFADGYSDSIKKIKSPKGTTLTGVVYCDNAPVEGVAVTDGKVIVKTDKDGIYHIASTKPYGLVYITTPSGYTTDADGVKPCFWAATVASEKKCERHDFKLHKVDDKKFSVIFCSDSHFCNDPKRKDLDYFRNDFMPAARKAFADAQGQPVYTVCLGDLTWDRFWEETGFALPQAAKLFEDCNYPTPIYTIMGNHDNDPSIPFGDNTDFIAENKYRNVFGPTFYSINIGDTHFVMLDDIVYKNVAKEGGKLYPGVVGSRNYDTYVPQEQIDWLEKDLASVEKSTPVILCMHAPLVARNAKGEAVFGLKKGEREKLLNVIKDFDCVRVFSGHKHQSHFFEVPGYANITETNVPSICGELWQTGSVIGRNICTDGADAGLFLCKFEGGNITDKVFYGHRDVSPIRLYDMNSVGKYYTDETNSRNLKHAQELLPNQTDYSDIQFENYVYINCWMCDNGTVLEATENGTPLTVEQVKQSDPLAAIAIMSPTMKKRKKIDKRLNIDSMSDHLYRVKASSATSPIQVVVKTPYGETYTEVFERPVSFPAL